MQKIIYGCDGDVLEFIEVEEKKRPTKKTVKTSEMSEYDREVGTQYHRMIDLLNEYEPE